MKKIVAFALAALMMLSMAACGASGSGSSAASSAPASEAADGTSIVDEIQEKGVLTMMTATGFPPFEYLGEDGAPAGMDIDLAQLIADELGVELEVDDGGKDSGNARKIRAVFNQNSEYGYIKSDGSLDDGQELVTHPCTLKAHLQEVPWEETLEKIRSLGYFSHQASTCGLHVHVNRSFFGNTSAQQDERIGHVLYLFERFWQELLRFSRRTQRQVEQWAARYGYKDTSREILEHAKKSYQGRYTCVNLTNANTIEFRIFRGTLKYNTLIATLQFVEKLCSAAISLSQEELQALSWSDLMLGIREQQYPELVRYLKERRLYVNEPIPAEGEV